MRSDALLLEIDGISKVFFIVDHFEVVIMDKIIRSVHMFLFLSLVCD